MKIPELRSRILYTLSLLFVARVGAHIPLPGLDPKPLQAFFADQTASGAGALVGLYNMFTGGALLKGAVCSLGIMPYISASIIFQLMTAVLPGLSRLQQEGDVGRQKLTQYTRYLTVVICLVQGIMLILSLENPGKLFSGFDVGHYGAIVIAGKIPFLIESTVILTAGTLLMMWLGEQITQRGIGNGVSLLITIGILADIPGAAYSTYQLFFAPVGTASLGLPQAVIMIVLFVVVIMGIIAVTQGQRKIPVQYAKRVVGQKVYGGQSSFLPLKVNYSGVMPVIFASAILLFPVQIFQQLGAAFDIKFFIELASVLTARQPVLLRLLRPAHPFLQLFLGLGHVQAHPSGRRSEEIRRLHSRGASGRADGELPRFHHDAPYAGWRDLPHGYRGHSRRSAQLLPRPAARCLFLRRHRHADHRRRHPRHHAPDRDLPAPAALRRIPQERSHSRSQHLRPDGVG